MNYGEEGGMTMTKDEMLDKIKLGLFRCGVEHDDIEFMADTIMQELEDEEIKVGGTD